MVKLWARVVNGHLHMAQTDIEPWVSTRFHVDSLAWSIGLGVIFCALFRWVAVRASATTLRPH